MYRVGGIASYDGHLLVEHDARHGFCFVPGGRVEYGENAVEALARELPASPEYIAHAEPGFINSPGHNPHL